MIRFIKTVTESLLVTCSNRPIQPYKMFDRILELKLVYRPPVHDVVTCSAHDPEFSGRVCYLNRRLEFTTQANVICNFYTSVVITCEKKGTLIRDDFYPNLI